MAKDEVLGGLKNAIDRGQSLDAAIKSLTNSGYDPAEVTAAAQTLNSGVTTALIPNQQQPVSQTQPPLSQSPGQQLTAQAGQQLVAQQPQQPQQQPPVKKKSSSTKIIVIIFVIAAILLVGGGVTLTLLFPDLIADLLG